ncbi:MAG: carboxypeptidase regulatory-like domain-containing protein [Vicinamibacterales bacterium]
MLGVSRILLVLSCLVVPGVAAAQVQTGSIFVKAVDEQGASVPGATVTATSPVLPQALVGVTDSTGAYRFPTLSVGTYAVRVSLTGFQTMVRTDVVVLQNQTITLEFPLKVSTVAEEVTVRGEAPVIDTRSASVNVNLDAKLLDTTPGGKDIWNILEYKVPGLIFDAPDVGGNQAGLQRAFTARGTPNSQNVQLLNGVNVGDPAAIGFSMNYYDPSSFENIQVTSGAQDISLGASGVVINMVTKSGTNQYSFQALQTYQGNGTQWDNIDTALKNAGFRPNANATELVTNTNAQSGGPIRRNRLFYFASLNNQGTHVAVPGFPAISPVPVELGDTSDLDTTDILTGTGRLTYQLNASNRFNVYGSKQRYDKPNRGANDTTTQDSNSKEYDVDNVGQVLWNWVLSDRLFTDTNISYNNVHFPLEQKTSQQPLNDLSTGVLLRNRTSTANMFRRRLSITSSWRYFIPEFAGGRHELLGGLDNTYTPEDVRTTRVDDVNLTYRSFATAANQPAGPVQVTIFNSPTLIKRAVNTTAIYAQDAYSRGRLTVIAGVRWERVEGWIPAQTAITGRFFQPGQVINGLNVTLNTGGTLTQYVVPDSFAEVRQAPLWKNWAPRISGTYDLTGRGKTVLKVSAGRYLDQIGTGTPGPNPNGTISQRYTWLDRNNDLVFQPDGAVWDGFKYVGGEFGALANNGTTIPNPNPFDSARRRTSRDEVTAGVDHELLAGVRLSVTFIHRQEHDPVGTVDLGLDQWATAYSAIPVIDPGRDGRTGTADDQTVTAYTLNPGVTLNTRTVNDDRLATTYNGLETTVTKRYANGFALLGGYTYAHTTADQTSLASPNAIINATGDNGGRRHLFKATASYVFPYRINFGVNLKAQSGLPIARTFVVQACSGSVTSNCLSQGNTTIIAEAPGSVTLPALVTLDLRGGRTFTVGAHRLELSLDVYNLTNANTTYAVRTTSTLTSIRVAGDPNAPVTQIPSFLSPTGVLGPRILRFNVTYWFR